MLRIDNGRKAAGLLGLRYGVYGEGGLTAGLRAEYLDHPAAGIASYPESMVQGNGAGGNHRHIPFRTVSELHDGTLAEILFYLVHRCLQGLELRCVSRGNINLFEFFCHTISIIFKRKYKSKFRRQAISKRL